MLDLLYKKEKPLLMRICCLCYVVTLSSIKTCFVFLASLPFFLGQHHHCPLFWEHFSSPHFRYCDFQLGMPILSHDPTPIIPAITPGVPFLIF